MISFEGFPIFSQQVHPYLYSNPVDVFLTEFFQILHLIIDARSKLCLMSDELPRQRIRHGVEEKSASKIVRTASVPEEKK